MNDPTGSPPSDSGPGNSLAETVAGAPDLRTRPLHESITDCARELWRSYGCPVGRDEQIWLEAERQVLGADPSVTQIDGVATSVEALAQAAVPASTTSPGGQGREVPPPPPASDGSRRTTSRP
jgi:Protein of unknown function (DUF2934)